MICFFASVPSMAQRTGRTTNLELVGTVVSNNSEMTLAIITDPSTRKQRVYHEGDRVGQKALIKKIMRNRVIIDAGDGDIMLSILHKGSSSLSSMAPASRLAMSNPGPARQTPAPTHVNSQNAQTRNLTVSLDRQEVKDALSDIGQVLELAPEQAEALSAVMPYGELEPARDHHGMGLVARRPGELGRIPLSLRDGRVMRLHPTDWPALSRPVEIG